MASSRCASLIDSTSSTDRLSISVMPSEAAMIVAQVEAMPFWVKVELYGPASPVSRSVSSVRISTASSLPGMLLAPEGERLVAVHGGEVHQLVRHLVVVLQGVHQRHRLDAEVGGQVQGEAEELGVAGGHGVVVGRPGDEVVRQVRAPGRAARDVVDRQVELLEGEAADLAHHAGDELVGGLRQRVALRPGRRVVGVPLHAEEAVGVQPQRAAAQVAEGVQRVADHQPHAGERRDRAS